MNIRKSPTLVELLSDVVKQRRRELNLSQEEIGQRSGLHRTYISDIERGRRNITLTSLESLSQGLELSLMELTLRVEKSRQLHRKRITARVDGDSDVLMANQ